ncbi:MAG TPA: helix-turn-helix transcriptional regulator [Trebonia sp.]|nr:helix-turn-helix transcriptional regulator [Trebonia sp.]
MTTVTSMRRRVAGAALRRYREQCGLDVEDAAGVLSCDKSKISRVESGERGITRADLTRLLSCYAIPTEEWAFVGAVAGPGHPPGWWQDYRALLPPDLLDFYSLEAAASEVLEWAPWRMPAILQARGYARAEAEADGVPPGLLDQAGDAAVARAEAIRRKGVPRVHVILGQDALHRRVGGQETGRDQFFALAHACEDDGDASQFTIQILPPGTVAYPGISAGPASILLFAPRPAPGLVRVPALSGTGHFIDDPDSVDGFIQAFIRLQSMALSPAESAELIRTYNRS